MGFSACVILFRHDHFDVITYEKSALYNTGDCLQLFFERRVDVVETGVEDKVAVFCKDRSVFATSGTKNNLRGTQSLQLMLYISQLVRKDLYRDGKFASQLIYTLAGVDDDERFAAASNQ